MDDIRQAGRESEHEEEKPWPLVKKGIDDMRIAYQLGDKDSILREYSTSCVVCHNPFVHYAPGSIEHRAWSDLFEELPDLALDVARAAGKAWSGAYAWDDQHRNLFMVEEPALGQLWEEHILRTRSREEIEAAAGKGCVRSLIELDHVSRGTRCLIPKWNQE